MHGKNITRIRGDVGSQGLGNSEQIYMNQADLCESDEFGRPVRVTCQRFGFVAYFGVQDASLLSNFVLFCFVVVFIFVCFLFFAFL